MKRPGPRWRHWHLPWSDFGYKLREAKAGLAHEREVGFLDRGYLAREDLIERCDIDHSLEPSFYRGGHSEVGDPDGFSL